MTSVEEGAVTRENLAEEMAGNFRVGLMTGLLGGLILGFLFAAATLSLNPELLGSATDVLILLLGLQAVYAVFCLAIGIFGAIGKTLIFARTGRRLSDTKTAASVTFAVFFLITGFYGYSWCRWHRIGGLSPDSFPGMSDLPILLAIIAVAALLARLITYAFYLLLVYFKKPKRRQPGDLRKAFLILLYMAGAFVIFVAALRLGGSPVDAGSGLTHKDLVPPPTPVLLLAVDGLDRRDIEELRHRGLLDWATPLEKGAIGEIPAPDRSIPPILWTRIATGQNLAAHGIFDFQTQEVRGLSRPFTVSPNQVGLFNLFQDVFPFFRLTRPVPMRSYMRGTKGLWNMATDGGLTTEVVNWWVSWPAEKIDGRIVTDRAFLRLANTDDPRRVEPDHETYPETLLLELWPNLDPLPDSAGGDRTVFADLPIPEDVLRSDLFYARSAAQLLAESRPDLWILHLPGPDILRRVLARSIEDPSKRTEAFDRAIDEYWATLGPVLADCFDAALTEKCRMIWISLPGTRDGFQEPAGPGIFAIAGPGIADGPIQEEFELDDVTPTLLWLLGLPAARDMPGRARTEILAPGAAEPLLPIRWISGYGRREVDEIEKGDGRLDQETLERFRSLGYIDG